MPNTKAIASTILTVALDGLLLLLIPYLLVSLPQANAGLNRLGIDPVALQAELAIFGLLIIALTVIKNFTRRGTIINLISGLCLIGVGVAFFFALGSINGPAPRLGFLTLSPAINGANLTMTMDYVGLALIWIAVAVLKAANHILGFIEARRSQPPLKLPLPPRAVPQLAPIQLSDSRGRSHK